MSSSYSPDYQSSIFGRLPMLPTLLDSPLSLSARLTPPTSPESRGDDTTDDTPVFSQTCQTNYFPVTPPVSPRRNGSKTPDRHCFNSSSTNRKSPFSTPDRFIPERSPDSHTNLHTGKPMHKLSSDERLHRKRNTNVDPFDTTGAARLKNIHQVLLSPGRKPRAPSNPHTTESGAVASARSTSASGGNRRVSAGSVWNVGGTGPVMLGPTLATSDGRGGYLGSGTNAPMLISRFFDIESKEEDLLRHETRLAFACGIDQANRVLQLASTYPSPKVGLKPTLDRTPYWKNGEWARDDIHASEDRQKQKKKLIPLNPFKVLDAPALRDDYYCSVLAYSYNACCLAVALENKVYLWSEKHGVKNTPAQLSQPASYVTSLSFSSQDGKRDILAVARQVGTVSLWSLFDESKRFELQHDSPIACVSFRPFTSQRLSEHFGTMTTVEDLLVGTEAGDVYYYSIEWPSKEHVDRYRWSGSIVLLAQIGAHSQQICGLAWAPDGEYFASGGNDNACCLFRVTSVLGPPQRPRTQSNLSNSESHTREEDTKSPNAAANIRDSANNFRRSSHTSFQLLDDGTTLSRHHIYPSSSISQVRYLEAGSEAQYWPHRAAVKAIAFCPWQRGLLATGGGSNDRCIHFWHTFSGACLATIHVAAQVTSLVWSTHRREIAATFGYAQPEHPYRIAVFSWPECRQVLAIPWNGEVRALYAIAYPGGPDDGGPERGQGTAWWKRTREEGCIVVASSEQSVKFHEVWSDTATSAGGKGKEGVLGGSDILESLAGIEKEGKEVIR